MIASRPRNGATYTWIYRTSMGWMKVHYATCTLCGWRHNPDYGHCDDCGKGVHPTRPHRCRIACLVDPA